MPWLMGVNFRVLNIIDDFNREALASEAAFSFPAQQVVEIMKRLAFIKGLPKKLRVDNGPEFMAKVFVQWCKEHQVQIQYIQPGKPVQNAYIERFNRLYREDVLDAYLFESLFQVRMLSEQWKKDYNLNHPHQSLDRKSPLAFAENFKAKAS